MTDHNYALQSLREGCWFKLICGASFQHLPAVRNLTLAYTLAGADCIDVAADPAVIAVAKEALDTAAKIGEQHRLKNFLPTHSPFHSPLLMVSLNDGEDPHFRKAEFDSTECPPDCLRPCESICPAGAINPSGVLSDHCYGCGRCVPICPIQHISTRSYVFTPETIAPLILESGVDAIEIHTQPGRLAEFKQLWSVLKPWIGQLKLIAISCPDGENLIEYLRALYDVVSPLPCPIVWQADGRPMSGDIGAGTTKAAVKLGQKVLQARLPGYVQLAGGTNHSTVPKLRSLGLLPSIGSYTSNNVDWRAATASSCHSDHVAGVAYGSYARVLLLPILEQLEEMQAHEQQIPAFPWKTSLFAQRQQLSIADSPPHLELVPQLLDAAVNAAYSLVSQLKPFSTVPLPTLDCASR